MGDIYTYESELYISIQKGDSVIYPKSLYKKISSSGNFGPLGDNHLGGHWTPCPFALDTCTHDRGPDNLVRASTWRNPQRINNNLN